MSKIYYASLFLFLLTVAPAAAQQWTPEQQEVWATLEEVGRLYQSGNLDASGYAADASSPADHATTPDAPLHLRAPPPPDDTLLAVRVNDAMLHYYELGSGEPIVFVHGALVDFREWGPAARELSSAYRTIAYSRRYNYPNPNRLAATDHSALVEADDLAALIRELGLGPVHVAGISYGAYTGLMTAIRHPELVRSLVIVEPALLRWAPALPGGQELYDDFMAMWKKSGDAFTLGDSLAALSAALDWFVAPGAMESIPPAFVAMLMGNIEEWRALTTSTDPFPELTPETLYSIEAPILLISGGRSYSVLRLIDGEVERHIRTGRRHVVPDGTHDVCANQLAV